MKFYRDSLQATPEKNSSRPHLLERTATLAE